MNTNHIIRIPSHDALWRYDQIANIELVEGTVSVFAVAAPHDIDNRHDYEYETEEDAKQAFAELATAWKTKLEE